MSALILAILVVLITMNTDQQVNLSYNEFLDKVEQNLVGEVITSDAQDIKVKLNGEEDITYIVPNPRSEDFKEFLLINGVKVVESETSSQIQLIQAILFIGLFLGIFYFVYKQMGQNQQGNKMKMDFKAINASSITFEDIAGNVEAKESVKDIIDFLIKPEKYAKYGARMPRGVIFYGPPGTGKTLMAKAIAGEADVPFFSVSGSDFVQMYVGVGASRIRELFKKAREHGKAVIFIDEIDALGKKRTAGAAGGNDERDQTLNALLTEMSGFRDSEGIVVIAATNRLDILDSALLRPGRFDRQVEIGLPDIKARESILSLHIRNKPLSEQINLEKLAKQTVYFSGAMLENLLNEAAIFAAKDGSRFIEMNHIDKAFYTVVAGAEKQDRSMIDEHDRHITAYHEAGHALMTKLVAPRNSVTKVTIIPSAKGAGGFSMNIPPDKMYYSKKDMKSQVMISLAGRAAEEIIFGEDEITTGASNDIEKATSIISDYVHKYGMSEKLGLLNMKLLNQGSESNAVAECRVLMNELYHDTRELLIENKYYLTNLAKALLEKETLSEDDIEMILAGEELINTEQMDFSDADDFRQTELNGELI